MPGCRTCAAFRCIMTSIRLPTTLTPEQIVESSTAPDALSFWDLPGYIRAAQAAGFSAARYQLYLYTLYALPALFAAMVFMAASFSLRLGREGGMAKVILFSAACGFGVFFFQNLTIGAGPFRRGADPAGGDGAGAGLDPDRHDLGFLARGWLMRSIRRSRLRARWAPAPSFPLLASGRARLRAPPNCASQPWRRQQGRAHPAAGRRDRL